MGVSMLAKRIKRSDGRGRAYLSLGLLGGMMVIVALALGHVAPGGTPTATGATVGRSPFPRGEG